MTSVKATRDGSLIRAQALVDNAVAIDIAMTVPLWTGTCGATNTLKMLGTLAGRATGDLAQAVAATVRKVIDGAASAETIIANPPKWLSK